MDFLPMPHHVRRLEGRFCIRYNGCIMLQDTEPSALLYARMLRDTIREETGLVLSIRRGQGEAGDIVLRPDQALAEKAYRVHVLPEGVTVSGGSDEALLNGVMTLCQWVQRHGVQLPALEIEDAPDLAARAYYLDCSRGRVPTLATLKRYADILCRYKINQWQLYIEHTYLFRHLSEAWRDDTPLTAEEILELDAYCRARHIELVPSLSSFGHMYKILSTRTCCELCELTDSEKKTFNYTYSGDHHTLRSDDARALAFITGLIDEYAALFTSRKFNICCDETFDLGKGRSAALVQEQGEHEVYIRHVAALCGHLVKRGITPMFWGDIVYRHPETYARLPKETICLNWGYLPNQREDEIRTLAEMGATQYACPGVCTWNRWLPLMENSYKNIRVMCRHGQKYHAIGMLNTDWGDGATSQSFVSSVYCQGVAACYSWNADNFDDGDLQQWLDDNVYGYKLSAIVADLGRYVNLQTQKMNMIPFLFSALYIRGLDCMQVDYNNYSDPLAFFRRDELLTTEECNATQTFLADIRARLDSVDNGNLYCAEARYALDMLTWAVMHTRVCRGLRNDNPDIELVRRTADFGEKCVLQHKRVWFARNKRSDFAKAAFRYVRLTKKYRQLLSDLSAK